MSTKGALRIQDAGATTAEDAKDAEVFDRFLGVLGG